MASVSKEYGSDGLKVWIVIDGLRDSPTGQVTRGTLAVLFRRSTTECNNRACCDFYNRKYRLDSRNTIRVPSGSQFSPKIDGAWSNSVSTLGPRVWDKSQNDYGFLSTAHSGLKQNGNGDFLEDLSDLSGRAIAQPDTERIGYIERGVHHDIGQNVQEPRDAMVIGTDSNYLPALGLAAQGNNEIDRRYMAGTILGLDRLRDMDAGTQFVQQGTRTGRCSEPFYEYNVYVGNSGTNHEIVLGRSYADGGGNSGGPYLVNDQKYDRLIIAGIHQRGATRTEDPGIPTLPPEFPGSPSDELDVGEGMYIGDIQRNMNVEVL